MGSAAAHYYDSGTVHAHRRRSEFIRGFNTPKVFSGLKSLTGHGGRLC